MKNKKELSWGSSFMRLVSNQHLIPRMVKREAKRNKNIIYGGQAMNIQLPGFLRRLSSFDWDVYTKNPRKSASRMEKRMDREIAGGRDDFFVKRAYHKGTYRVVHEGPDERQKTRDDIPIVDYTTMPKKKPEIVSISGVKYQSVSSIEKEKEKLLKKPKAKFRHEKDKYDLESIHAFKKISRID